MLHRHIRSSFLCLWSAEAQQHRNVYKIHGGTIFHFSTRQSHMESYKYFQCTIIRPIELPNTHWVKLMDRTTSNWPSCAFLTFSSTCAHCSMRVSLGAPRKKVHLKVPRLRMCWRCLYSRPISRLMHSRRSMILCSVLDDSAAFLDLLHSRVLF